MPPSSLTLIDERRPTTVRVMPAEERFEVFAEDVEAALGWAVTPQGLCKDAVCIPLEGSDLLDGTRIELGRLAQLLRRPLAVDLAEHVAVLGASVSTRADQLASLEAPEFTLPGLDGTLHSLSDYRGQKVLLIAYASW